MNAPQKRRLKYFFILSFGCVGCSYFVAVDYGFSIKCSKVDYFIKYVQFSIMSNVTDTNYFTNILQTVDVASSTSTF